MTPGATRRGTAFCASWRRADVATRALDSSSPGRRGVRDLDAGSPPGRCLPERRARAPFAQPLELFHINRDRKIAVTAASDRQPWGPPRTPWERRLARADAAFHAAQEGQEPRACRRCVALKRVRLPLK